MENIKENKIALLIDADNAQAELIKNILAEAGKHDKSISQRYILKANNNQLLTLYVFKPIQTFLVKNTWSFRMN